MSQCIGIGGHCCCMRARVRWCDYCQLWICRQMYCGHRCLTPPERQVWNARRGLISWLSYRTYLLRKEEEYGSTQ